MTISREQRAEVFSYLSETGGAIADDTAAHLVLAILHKSMLNRDRQRLPLDLRAFDQALREGIRAVSADQTPHDIALSTRELTTALQYTVRALTTPDVHFEQVSMGAVRQFARSHDQIPNAATYARSDSVHDVFGTLGPEQE